MSNEKKERMAFDSPYKKPNDAIIVNGYIVKPRSDIESIKKETDIKARIFYFNHFSRKQKREIEKLELLD